MTIQIIEIIGRAEQGVTQPFICRGDDGHTYFVKGHGAGRRSQICEWIAGNLALRLGLPVAPFALVEVPDALLELGLRDDLYELGAGVAFGSRRLTVTELSISQRNQIPADLQRTVLSFDWWIHNADRSLGEQGGNPNLFWDIENRGLVVIDHNQAFDRGFSAQAFVKLHVFCHQLPVLCGDLVFQQHFHSLQDRAMMDWPEICAAIPEEWWFFDPEQTVPTDFDLASAHRLLLRYQTTTFWRMP